MIQRLFLAVCLIITTAVTDIDAQKICVVEMDRILQSLPDYKIAQDNLDDLSAKWRQEITQEMDKIKGMYNKYQADQVLLPDDARKQREDEIAAKEKTVRDLQKERFGPEGLLFKKRQEFVRPIQDRVYGAIQRFCDEKGYDFVFDKGGSAGLIFARDTNDKTNDILKMLK
jgi:outer membrane protein